MLIYLENIRTLNILTCFKRPFISRIVFLSNQKINLIWNIFIAFSTAYRSWWVSTELRGFRFLFQVFIKQWTNQWYKIYIYLEKRLSCLFPCIHLFSKTQTDTRLKLVLHETDIYTEREKKCEKWIEVIFFSICIDVFYFQYLYWCFLWYSSSSDSPVNFYFS